MLSKVGGQCALATVAVLQGSGDGYSYGFRQNGNPVVVQNGKLFQVGRTVTVNNDDMSFSYASGEGYQTVTSITPTLVDLVGETESIVVAVGNNVKLLNGSGHSETFEGGLVYNGVEYNFPVNAGSLLGMFVNPSNGNLVARTSKKLYSLDMNANKIRPVYEVNLDNAVSCHGIVAGNIVIGGSCLSTMQPHVERNVDSAIDIINNSTYWTFNSWKDGDT